MSAGFAANDMVAVAKSLVEMGVVTGAGSGGSTVDVNSLANDLGKVMQSLQRTMTTTTTPPVAAAHTDAAGATAAATATSAAADASPSVSGLDAGVEVAGLALEVVGAAERNGLVLPREFGLLVKQGLYFDR